MTQKNLTITISAVLVGGFLIGGGVWYLSNSPSGRISFVDDAPAPSATSTQLAEVIQSVQPAETSSPVAVAVPTSSLMELTDANQAKLDGTLVVDQSSTAVSADRSLAAAFEYIEEYPVIYSFNDGAGPNLILDKNVYLVVAAADPVARKEIGVVDLAPDGMIAAAKSAPRSAQYALVARDLAWTADNLLTGGIDLYNAKNLDNPVLLQSATFTLDPVKWTVEKK